MPITGHELWSLDTTIRLHYMNDKYNAVSAGFSSAHTIPYYFNRAKDRELFVRAGKQFNDRVDAVWYICGNRSRSVKHISAMSMDNMIPVKRYAEAPLNFFKEDLQKMREHNPSFDYHLKCDIGDLSPPIFSLVSSGDVSIETVSILEEMTKFMRRATKVDPLGINKARALLLRKHFSFFQHLYDFNNFAHTAKKEFTV
jgi:hypothetical protein